MVSCLSCSWRDPSGGGEGQLVPGLRVKLPSCCVSTAEQEGRETAVSSQNIWKDSGFKAGLNFNGWFKEAMPQLKAPPWICGSRQGGDAQGSEISKSWPRDDSGPLWGFQKFQKKKKVR